MSTTSEKTLYRKGDIRITRTLLQYKDTLYLIRSIDKVRRIKIDPNPEASRDNNLLPVIVIGLILALVTGQPVLFLVALIFSVILTFDRPNNVPPPPTYMLIIYTKAGEEITIEPISSYDIEPMQSALETALDTFEYRW